MNELDTLIARPGERVAPKWNGLIAYLRRLTRYRAANGIRLRTNPDGTSVIADQRGALFVPHFKVSIQGGEARVGAGLVNGIMPRISGVRLDGKTDDGSGTRPVPSLPLSGGPDGELRSWIVLTARVDPQTRALLPDDGAALGIAHRIDVPDRLRGGASTDDNGTGIYPLALLVWRDKRSIERAHQIVMHDLNHAFAPAGGGRQARHYFWPA